MAVSRTQQRREIDRARSARAAAQDLAAYLDALPSTERDVKVELSGGPTMVLPRLGAELLVEILEALGDGQDPSLLPKATKISTGAAAELLEVSRQYVVRLLDKGRIPSERVGNRRRVLAGDVLRYRRDDNRRRAQQLAERLD